MVSRQGTWCTQAIIANTNSSTDVELEEEEEEVIEEKTILMSIIEGIRQGGTAEVVESQLEAQLEEDQVATYPAWKETNMVVQVSFVNTFESSEWIVKWKLNVAKFLFLWGTNVFFLKKRFSYSTRVDLSSVSSFLKLFYFWQFILPFYGLP